MANVEILIEAGNGSTARVEVAGPSLDLNWELAAAAAQELVRSLGQVERELEEELLNRCGASAPSFIRPAGGPADRCVLAAGHDSQHQTADGLGWSKRCPSMRLDAAGEEHCARELGHPDWHWSESGAQWANNE